jgi:CheY-like chemotaxis protein
MVHAHMEPSRQKAREQVTLILADLGMPEEDGYALIRKVRGRGPGTSECETVRSHVRAPLSENAQVRWVADDR